MRKFFTGLFILLFSIALIGGGALLYIFSKTKQEMPNLQKLISEYKPLEPTSIYDVNGNLISRMFLEDRQPVSISEIPQDLRDAFVAIEDKRFYEHNGVDYLRTGKSVFENVVSGRKAQGGSTITQQLSRNAFLDLNKTYTRKIKEVIIARELEKSFTKDQILEMYLNKINFGQQSYGVKVAAKTYFDKELSDLTLAESAMLAGIPNRPTTYNPMKKLPNAIERMNLVLLMMLRNNFITQAEYDLAKSHKFVYEDEATDLDKSDKNTTIVMQRKRIKRGTVAPEFVDYVTKELMSKFDEDEIKGGGYKVYTTIDLNIQAEAEKALKESKALAKHEDRNGALVSLDPNTGYIKAMVGGRDNKAGDFNRATDAKRQPGSSFKPFVYFTALDKGYSINSMVEDSLVTYGSWTPKNYGGGPTEPRYVTLLEAIKKSLNTVAVKIANEVGIDAVIERAKLAGIESPIPSVLSVALGSNEVTPLELARGYATFANGGYNVKPIAITKVTDRDGNTLYENKIERKLVFNPKKVAEIVYMMIQVVNAGTGTPARAYYNKQQVAIAGKTGTTNDSRSAWFAGFSPDLVTTIYVGKDNNKPMSGGTTGGNDVAPIFGKYYNSIISNGYYKPTMTFAFVRNINLGIGNTLVTELIDPVTGLPITSGAGTEVQIKREDMAAEKAETYNDGLEGFFDDSSKTTTNDTTKPKTETKPKEEKKPKSADKQKQDDIEKTLDDIFN